MKELTELEKLWQKKYGNCYVGYSEDMRPNEDWEDMGIICPYSHCIENMPLHPSNPKKRCPYSGICVLEARSKQRFAKKMRGNRISKGQGRSQEP